MNRRESGYSLVEILVVVAIIGVISLVTVPNFIAMQHNGKLKNSMRLFVSDVRAMRQRAVTRHRQTKVSFNTGTAVNATEYFVAEYDPATTTWNQVGPKRKLDEACYFLSQTNLTDADSDGAIDIIFKPDGTPVLPPNTFTATAVIKTDWTLPRFYKQSVPGQYTIEIKFSGAVQTS